MKKNLVLLLGLAVLGAVRVVADSDPVVDNAHIVGVSMSAQLNEKDQAYVQKFYTVLDSMIATFTEKNDVNKLKILNTIKNVCLQSVFFAPSDAYETSCYVVGDTLTACTLEYAPVCGSDIQTYGNACSMNAAKVEKLHDGECVDTDKPEACTEEYAPVCGNDGKTYGNLCNLKASDAGFLFEGKCEDAIATGKLKCIHTLKPIVPVCTKEFDPVCGSDNTTYSNKCLAEAAGIEYTEGACVVVPCTKEYVPVCGKDGETYSNSCLADAAGTEIDSEGVCK